MELADCRNGAALAHFDRCSNRAFPGRSKKFTYIRLNISTPCPPRSAVPVNAQDLDPGLMLHGWPRNNEDFLYNGRLPWWHGDYKDVAYIYVQELYKKWVELTK